MKNLRTCAAVLLAILGLAACGGGGGSSTPTPTPTPSYSIGGTVTGLGTSPLTLRLNGGNDLTIHDNSVFSFGTEVNGTYSVTIEAQPSGQSCGIANGSGQASADVTTVEVTCLDAVTVSGIVTDAPIPFAEITAEIDGEIYSTTADAEGAYELQVLDATGVGLVVLEARGSTGQEAVRFTHLLGFFDDLPPVLDDTNITNVTTARHILVRRANGGAEPESKASLLHAERDVDAAELLDLATAIKLVVDHPDFSLPTPFVHVLEFAQNRDAVAALIESARAGTDPFSETRSEILADPALIPPVSADELATVYLVVPAAAPGLMARTGEKLELDADGTGTLLTSLSEYAHSSAHFQFTWTVADGRLRLDFVGTEPNERVPWRVLQSADLTASGAATQEEVTRLNQEGIYGVSYREVPVEATYQFVSRGQATSTVEITKRARWVFEEVDLGGGEIMSFDDIEAPTTVVLTPMSDIAELPVVPFQPDLILGKWGVYLFRDYEGMLEPDQVVAREFVAEVVEFGAGGSASGGQHLGIVQWAIHNSGNLVVDYDSGWSVEYRIIEQFDPVFGVFMEARHGTGQRFGSFDFIVRGDSNLQVGPESIGTATGEVWRRYSDIWQASLWDDIGPLPVECDVGPIRWKAYAIELNVEQAQPFYCLQDGTMVEGAWAFGTWSIAGDGHAVMDSPTNVSPKLSIDWQPLGFDDSGFFYVVEDEIRDSGGTVVRWYPPRVTVIRKEPKPLN